MESDHALIKELKDQDLKQFELKNRLDGKASNLITISITTTTFLLGFGIFLLTNMERTPEVFSIYSIFGISGIVATGLTVLFSTLSYTLKPYRYVMNVQTVFFDENGKYREDIVIKFRKASAEQFNDTMIEDYIKAIHENENTNDAKAGKIKFAQWFFVGAMVCMLLFVIMVFLTNPMPLTPMQ